MKNAIHIYLIYLKKLNYQPTPKTDSISRPICSKVEVIPQDHISRAICPPLIHMYVYSISPPEQCIMELRNLWLHDSRRLWTRSTSQECFAPKRLANFSEPFFIPGCPFVPPNACFAKTREKSLPFLPRRKTETLTSAKSRTC
jgi:hypothetical protein